MRLIPNAREHQELRRVNCAPAHDDLRPAGNLHLCPCSPFKLIQIMKIIFKLEIIDIRILLSPITVLDANGALPLEDDPRDEDVLFRRYVPSAQGGSANATCSAFFLDFGFTFFRLMILILISHVIR